MSKPPSKSGGSGRGRPPHGSSSGGSSRDRSSFGGSSSGGESRGGGSRHGSQRDGAPRGGRGREETAGGAGPRYNSGGSRSGGGRDDGARSGGGSRSGYSRDAAPRDGGYRGGSRDGAPRGDAPRSGAPREGGYRGGGPREDSPRGGQRGGYSRDGAPREGYRADSPRSNAPRDGGPRPPRRDDAPRDAAPREVHRSGTPRGAYSRDDAPRGGSRGGAPHATYSRGPRDDRRDERGGGGRFGRGDAPRPPRPIANPGPAPRAAKPTPKNPLLPARDGERIAKLLARAGVASRREVERLIAEGRVRIGDQVVEEPSTVLTSLAGVTVDGNLIADPEGTRLFLFHKPAGLITAERDPAGRPTIYNALRNALPEGSGRVMPIGRLDLNTEGLLLLTNDGEFKRQLELPSTGVPRTYRARTFGDITQSRLEELMEGIEVDGVIYGKINANMERRTGRNQWIEMTLTEGKNREVRRVLEALDLQVSRLLRVAYGPFVLGDMPKGTAGEVSQKDLENFRRTLRESAAREANSRKPEAPEPASSEPEAEEPEA
jgi:23S rRNA pseudouridine2605 synthase